MMKVDIHAYLTTENSLDLIKDMEDHDIEIRVVSPSYDWDISQGNNEVSNLASQYPGKIYGCIRINPKLNNCVEELKRALALPYMVMVEFNSFEDSYFADANDNLRKLLTILNDKNIPIKIFTGLGSRSMPQQWEKVLLDYPNINTIFLAMGMFDYGYSCIDIVNRHKNFYVETSNQYELQIFKKAFNTLDESKFLFGTSYPTRLTSNGIDIFNLYQLSENFQNKIFYQNALDVLNLKK